MTCTICRNQLTSLLPNLGEIKTYTKLRLDAHELCYKSFFKSREIETKFLKLEGKCKFCEETTGLLIDGVHLACALYH